MGPDSGLLLKTTFAALIFFIGAGVLLGQNNSSLWPLRAPDYRKLYSRWSIYRCGTDPYSCRLCIAVWTTNAGVRLSK